MSPSPPSVASGPRRGLVFGIGDNCFPAALMAAPVSCSAGRSRWDQWAADGCAGPTVRVGPIPEILPTTSAHTGEWCILRN
jgi:hypothetical protein